MHHHHHSDYVETVSALGPQKVSGKLKTICIIMMIVGFGAFALNAFGDSPRVGWIAFLHNFYFFTGISAAGVVVAAILRVTHAMWGQPIRRFAEAYGAFLPYSIGFAVVLYFGADHIYEWIEKAPDKELFAHKNFWLQKNFVFARVLGYLIVIAGVAHMFAKNSARADIGIASEHNDAWTKPSDWKGAEQEKAETYKKNGVWAVVYCLVYAFGISMVAYDLIMSLDYRWISTMFGGWNFTSFMLLTWGTLHMVTHFMSNRFGIEKYMHTKLYHDLGKLTFGFTVVWGYLTFAQIMVIWYGNLAHETGWFITRTFDPTWQHLTITVVAMVFVLPFALGLSKKRKMSPYTFAPVVIISFVGMWLERFMLIAPSAWYYDRHEKAYEGGVGALLFWDAIVFLGFAGVFILVFTSYLYKRPVMCIHDPKIDEGINRH